MKKIFLLIIFCISIFFGNVYAYNLTNSDIKLVDTITKKIEIVIENKGKSYRLKFTKKLKKLSKKYNNNDRLKTIINKIIDNLDIDGLSIEKMLLGGTIEENKVDLNDLLHGVFNLTCTNFSNWTNSSGTAFLMKVGGKNVIFTNRHVFEGSDRCFFGVYTSLSKDVGTGILFYIDSKDYKIYNTFSDFGAFYLPTKVLGFGETLKTSKNYMSLGRFWEENGIPNNVNLSDKLNYEISSLESCGNKMKIGTKVYIIGYPKFGMTETQTEIPGYGKINSVSKGQILTDGIISGYSNQTSSTDISKDIYPFDNYYVSNKMDSGNSGGPAIAEYNNELCLLGLATWVNTGNFDNQGIIQNINNIYYSEDK